MKLRASIESIYYCVPLSSKQWDRLNEIKEDGEDRWDEVKSKLEKVGVLSRTIEYNGHFGRNIFFGIARASSLPRVLRTIAKLVKEVK